MSALRVLHLYPRALGINGDAGNVLALRQRLQWRGIPVEVVAVEAGERLPHDVDLVHIGSGPRSARDALLVDVGERADQLQAWASSGVPMIGIGAGFHALSRSIVGLDGAELAGAGVLPATIRDITTRTVGEALGMPADGRRLAGYLNYAVDVDRHEAEPLVELDRAPSAASRSTAEGVRAAHLIGTHLHGPVLPMNPWLADELLAAALARHGQQLPPADERVREVDEHARRARAAIAARLGRGGVAV
ncbi:cobyric acid synthase [Microcella sp.]|uniref:cobyric acid synthase n=1 Tax=Microcella sp. TaxID=1913979 RepID=UPI00255F357B|nr:cobyric acid synthase [Microcella sp.]MBX9470930.1 cobyric acid synthase [Microcella sp.]